MKLEKQKLLFQKMTYVCLQDPAPEKWDSPKVERDDNDVFSPCRCEWVAFF